MKIKKKILAILLAYTLTMTSVPTTLFAEEITEIPQSVTTLVERQTTTSAAIESKPTTSPDIQINTNKYVGDGYEVEFKVVNKWPGAFQGEFVLTNTSNQSLENWTLKYDFNHEITNIWNAQILEYETNSYVIKNIGNNQDIAPGTSVSIGFQANWDDEIKIPKSYDVLITNQEVENKVYTIDCKVTSDWGQAFNGQISVANNTKEVIEDWTLEFDFDRNIERFWTAEIVEHKGNHYIIKNAGYNSNIEAGQTITLGFCGNPGNVDSKPKGYKLTQINETDVKQDAKITMNLVDNLYIYEPIDGYIAVDEITAFAGTVSLMENHIKNVEVRVTAGHIELPQDSMIIEDGTWILSNPQMLIGDNLFNVTVYGENGLIVEYNTHIWNTSLENMNKLELDNNDNDEDGLKNYQEIQYGTNLNNKDTDGDGFSDIDELFILSTDPLVYTKDGDIDEDELTNKEELFYNTDLKVKDTDSDGLTDYEEIKIYGTNPRIIDTDEDGITDLLEISYGLNPCQAEQEAADGTIQVVYTPSISSESKVIPTLEISLLPDQLESLQIEMIKEDDSMLSNEVPGYIGLGCGYDFNIDGAFVKAKLTYEFDYYLLQDDDFEPAIYYYNEETQLLEKLPNAILEENKITIELEHFSKYILLNSKKYEAAWIYELLYQDGEISFDGMDIAFVIDSSGSMTSNDATGVRKTVTKNFISKLTENDKAAIVDFDSRAYVYSDFTNSKTALNVAVDKINSSGGTNLSTGIETAINLFTDTSYSDNNKHKCIIMLTDGQGYYDTSYTTRAKNNNITIYTIGLGSGVSTDVLTRMAEGTGGQYYHASQASQLYVIFDNIAQKTELSKDTDSDGLVDYYEKEIAKGNLRLGTGVEIKGINYNNPDSDEDGLKDGEEIKIVKAGDKVYVYMYSNHTRDDTDNDGIDDYIETHEIKTNIGTYNQKGAKYKLNPLKRDSDNDGVSDRNELGTYYENLGYYRVKSNPFIRENINIGSQGAVSYISASTINMPVFTKKEFSKGTMYNGKSYTVYTFTDTSAIPFSTRKLVQVGEGSSREYYLLFARAGNNVRGGQNDEIYRKAKETRWGKLTVSGSLIGIGNNAINAKPGAPVADRDPEEFLYYDSSRGNFMSSRDWKDKIHFTERFELNQIYDTFLPITAYEAKQRDFSKLPQSESVYHMPDGIRDETTVGASYKYVTRDGLEAIYEILYNGSVDKISNDPKGTKLLELQEYPNIGPTFNYAPNDSSKGWYDAIQTKISDSSIAHYYFDMLPYYWWDSVSK